jgi:hypothetical protein
MLMSHLTMNISTPHQMMRRNIVGSALVVRTERAANDMKRNVMGAFNLAKLQTNVNRNRNNNDNNNNSRRKTTGASIILEPPMSPVTMETPAPAQIQLQQVTVIVSSEKNQS